MSGLLGKLNVLLSADTAQFTGAMDKAAYKANKTMNGILRTVRGIAPQLAAAISVGALASSFKKVIDDADQLNKAAQKIGVSVEALSVFRHAAKLANIEFEDFTNGIARFSRNVSDASQGLKGPARAFEALNIQVTDSSGKLRMADDLLLDVAERFSKMEDGVRKAALAQELFGRSGVNMIPLLNQGKEGFAQARAEAEKFGIVITSQTAASAELFNDNITRLNASLNGVFVNVANKTIPVLVTYTEQMLQANSQTKSFHTSADLLSAAVKNIAVGIRVTTGVVEVLSKSMGIAKNTIDAYVAASKFDFTKAIEIQKQSLEELDGIYKKTVSDSMALIDSYEKLNDQPAPQMFSGAADEDQIVQKSEKVVEVLDRQQTKIKETGNIMREMGATFTSSFEEAILSGEKFGDVMNSLWQDIERILLRKLILEPLFNSIFNGMGSFFGGANAGGAAVASAHGNVFSGGRLMKFASGGVIGGPMSFPLAGGGRGLAGEAGPEAIIPLRRTSGGDLGVKADLGGRVQVNVYAPPGSSVKEERKSEGGMESINIYIDEAVAGNISRSGSKTQRALKNQFGLGQELTRR